MATQAEQVEILKAVAAQQQKSKGEIQALQTSMDGLKQDIVKLEEIVAAGGNASPELVAAVAEVKAGAQETDDLIPDPPTPIPAP